MTNRGLDELVAERGDALLATARLLAGSRHGGEDLLQTTLERVLRTWKRIEGDPEAHVRRALYHQAVEGWRVRRRRPEALVTVEPPPADDHADATVLRQALLAALLSLPPRQRTVLAVRYFEQRTEAETADLLGCSLGTVKSTASRALATLRERADLTDVEASR